MTRVLSLHLHPLRLPPRPPVWRTASLRRKSRKMIKQPPLLSKLTQTRHFRVCLVCLFMDWISFLTFLFGRKVIIFFSL